ncbi:ABC transporter permease [Actinocorallia populi]|uniref:ABC transporter permease n=1 Tax=Actinocorallia populi TaxID=2079200 RepID=UPI000D0871F0|nr:hypothetical protein [Actinocorallia populi]
MASAAPAHHAAPSPAGADPAVLRLMVRLVRRGVLLLALGLALFALVEAVSYAAAYPDAASRARIGEFQDSPAVRMMQGLPHAVDTVGGFVVWDGGWMMQSIAAIWALLVTGRLLRGEEETERAEFVLTGPVHAGRVLLLQFLVIGCALLLAGAAVAATLSASDAAAGGSVLFGLGIAGFAATFAGIAAVLSQLFVMRRRVTALTATILGSFYVLRMVANSDDALTWLHWATPYGWMDELHAYRDPNWAALALLLLAPAALAVAAARLRLARDTGGALLAEKDSRPPRDRLLGGPTAFAWRTTRGMLLGWAAGICLYALITGLLVDAVADFIADDPSYRSMLESIGWDAEKMVLSFVGMMGTMLGLFTSLYACWRIGAARAEESAGRLDAVLVRPVSRERWLGGHLALTAAGATLIAFASGLAMWAGIRLTGGGPTLADVLGATLNALPAIAFFTGLALLVYGLAPRLAVALPAAAAFTAYLVEMIGPGLDWPEPVLALSPFHHLEPVPAEPFAPVAAAVLTGLGLVLAALGLLAFHRRDLTGD